MRTERAQQEVAKHRSRFTTRRWRSTLNRGSPNHRLQLNEEIVYSGIRWQFQPVPDGESVPQNCGIEHGSRTVSGTVVATEPAAMAWVKKQHALPFPTGTGGGGAPAIRYESPPRIQRSWEFLPITDGSARGSGSNATFVRVSFTFQETLLAFPYVEV